MLNDEASFIDFFRVDALFGFKLEVAVTGCDAEERSHTLGFKNADGSLHFAIEVNGVDE